MKNIKVYLFLFVTFSFCKVGTVFSQVAINAIDLYSDSFRERQRTISEAADKNAYSFNSRTNGIVFQAVATPSKFLKSEKVGLDISDGKFVVTVGNKKIYPNLPFWQLIPIANYANSPYQVIFTAHGDTVDNKEAQCKFHRAFYNTLLGLRLFQADLINYPDYLWDLPVDKSKKYITAPSENNYTPKPDVTVARKFATLLTDDKNKFSSYVLTDKNADIIFDLSENELVFSGHPYYLFVLRESNEKNIEKIRAQIDQLFVDIDASAKVLLKEKYTSDLNPRTNLKGLMKVFDENPDLAKFNPYSAHSLKTSVSKLESIANLSDDDLGMRLNLLSDLSNTFDSNWQLLKKYNPLVYSAVENTAWYSALFRYVYNTNPTNWAEFQKKIREMKTIPDAPEVKTPTSFEINYFRMFGDELKD